MEFHKRPNRSDAHVSVEEEAKQEEETRGYFEGIAPKRHSKPQRSEYSIQYVDALTTNGDQSFNPEYVEFQRLETDPQVSFLSFHLPCQPTTVLDYSYASEKLLNVDLQIDFSFSFYNFECRK